ncbi:hypothetical protein, partial [Microcoleus sp.]|uniref:hypothetical protein n=1 Tax=Microcoleus sp. TaxID=44472 RepID=UPI00403EBE5C
MIEAIVTALNSATFWTAIAPLAASLAALAALLSALFAALYTYLTFRLVRSQSEPNVVVYVKHDESRPTMIQIVVENIGRGLATDIRFTSSRPIPIKAWGVTIDQSTTSESLTEGPLIDGIPSLGPGDSRKITWGQYGGLIKAIGNEELSISYRYKDGARKMPIRSAILECRSFTGTDAVDSEALRVVKELKRIANALEKTLKNPSSLSFLVLILFVISCANSKDREIRTLPSPTPANLISFSANSPANQKPEALTAQTFAANVVCSLPKLVAPNTPFADLGGGTWGKWDNSGGELAYGCNGGEDSIWLLDDSNFKILAEYGVIGGVQNAHQVSVEYMAVQYAGLTPAEKKWRQQYADFCDKLSAKFYGVKLPE